MALLHLDNDVPLALGGAFRQLRHDAVTALDLGLANASDPVQLRRAAEADRILLSHNQVDYVLLHQAWLDWARAWSVDRVHRGIIIVPQYPPGRDLATAMALHEPLSRDWRLDGQLWRWNPRHGWKRLDIGGRWGDWLGSPFPVT